LQQYLFLTEPKLFNLRGRALECWGHLAVATKADAFMPYFETGMTSAQKGVELDDEDLKEYAFLFIANTVKVMKDTFAPYLPSLVPYLLDLVEDPEVMQEVSEDEFEEEEAKANNPQAEQEAKGNEDDDEPLRLKVLEGFVNSKRSAVTCLGALAEHCPTGFVPFLARTLEAVITEDLGSIYSLHDDIRSESAAILQRLVKAACVGTNVTYPVPAGVEPTLHPDTANAIRECVKACLIVCVEDDDQDTVGSALESLESIIRNVGMVVLKMSDNDEKEPTIFINRIMNICLLLITEKTPCQLKAAGDDEDEEENANVVIDALMDVITCLAGLLKEEFIGFFEEFHKHLLKFTNAQRPSIDRTIAIGCYADAFSKIGPRALQFADSILPAIHGGLSDSLENLRRNSAVCVGSLVQVGGENLYPHYLTLLQWLHPLCIRQDQHRISDGGGSDVDNALGAVSRMIVHGQSAVPMAQVLPVLLQALPLTDDHLEGPYIYRCIGDLLLKGESTALSLFPNILVVFAETLQQQSSAVDETKTTVASTLRELVKNSQFQQVIIQYASSIADPVDQQIFRTQVLEP
jgi:importin-4